MPCLLGLGNKATNKSLQLFDELASTIFILNNTHSTKAGLHPNSKSLAGTAIKMSKL